MTDERVIPVVEIAYMSPSHSWGIASLPFDFSPSPSKTTPTPSAASEIASVGARTIPLKILCISAAASAWRGIARAGQVRDHEVPGNRELVGGVAGRVELHRMDQ